MEEVVEYLLEMGAVDVSYPSLMDQRYLYQLKTVDINLLINLSDSIDWQITDGRPTVDKTYWRGLPAMEIIHQVRKFSGNLRN